MPNDLILVKLGGSVITDINKPNTAKREEIRRIMEEIKKAKSPHIIVGHGSGSFGHVTAHEYQVNLGLINENSMKGASLTQNVAAKLHRIVIDEACDKGLNPLSFAPSSSAVTENKKIVNWNIKAMQEALKKGFLPVVCGDVTIDLKQGVAIASTEEVLSYIARKLKAQKIIIGGDTDGVFTSNPKLDRSAKLIPYIDGSNIDTALKGAGASTKIDVTGGMKTKLEYLYNISKETGATCQIINITIAGRLYSALKDEKVVGTVIKA